MHTLEVLTAHFHDDVQNLALLGGRNTGRMAELPPPPASTAPDLGASPALWPPSLGPQQGWVWAGALPSQGTTCSASGARTSDVVRTCGHHVCPMAIMCPPWPSGIPHGHHVPSCGHHIPPCVRYMPPMAITSPPWPACVPFLPSRLSISHDIFGRNGQPPRTFTDTPLTSISGGPGSPGGPCQRKDERKAVRPPVAPLASWAVALRGALRLTPHPIRSPEGRGSRAAEAPAHEGLEETLQLPSPLTAAQHLAFPGGQLMGSGALSAAHPHCHRVQSPLWSNGAASAGTRPRLWSTPITSQVTGPFFSAP